MTRIQSRLSDVSGDGILVFAQDGKNITKGSQMRRNKSYLVCMA